MIRALTISLVLSASLCTLSACHISSDGRPGAVNTLPRASDADPFRPATLRIHPLTHADRTATPTRIFLHLELNDRYGDAVKALGKLRIEMGEQGAIGAEVRQTAWAIAELADPEENVKRFDTATRTYRIVLNAPTWVTQALEEGEKAKRELLTIRVFFELPTVGAESPIYLRDTYELR